MKSLRVFFLILIVAASGILLAAADFGESSANLGQITDEFDTLDNVSVRVLIERNATLNAMELNYSLAGDPIENFTTYTVVDEDGDITITTNKLEWDSLRRDAITYVWRDEGAGNIGDFHWEFILNITDVEAGDASSPFVTGFIFNSNTAGTVWGLDNQPWLTIMLAQSGATDDTFGLGIRERKGSANQINAFTGIIYNAGSPLYLTFNRTGADVDLFVYTDAARTVLDGTASGTGNGDSYRYFEPLSNSGRNLDAADHHTGFIDNLRNGTRGAGYRPLGYFTTTDQLASINGSVLVQLTNATIPAGTGITAEFSADNSTWVNPTNLIAGFMSIDLRDLNWSTAHYVRYNMSGTISETPRLYQSRLITSEGPIVIVAGAPGQNVSRETVIYNLTEIGVIVGTLDSGDLNSTLDIDGDFYNVSEVVGAPGMQISGNFSGVDPDVDCLWILIYAHYDGNMNHDLDIEIWDFTSSAWVDVSHIIDGLGLSWFNSTIYALRIPNEFLSGGEVRVQIRHESPGNINHDIFIEYFKLLAEIPAGPTPGAGAVTVTIVESDFPWIAIAIILMCVAYLLLRPK